MSERAVAAAVSAASFAAVPAHADSSRRSLGEDGSSREGGSAARRTRVNGSKCDCLGPPVRVGALREERVDERVIEFARLY